MSPGDKWDHIRSKLQVEEDKTHPPSGTPRAQWKHPRVVSSHKVALNKQTKSVATTLSFSTWVKTGTHSIYFSSPEGAPSILITYPLNIHNSVIIATSAALSVRQRVVIAVASSRECEGRNEGRGPAGAPAATRVASFLTALCRKVYKKMRLESVSGKVKTPMPFRNWKDNVILDKENSGLLRTERPLWIY